ncbi:MULTISPECIES: hypothetical protein [unclassified Streptomyces]|uniref:hypothetical protein n=1 Tax=unclassified Streptomyces TaxID=2593676 RepID=UPI000648011F|nr:MULTISPECIES: hypothetical protein [unclassified Streptomyces]MCG5121606.1 hypothetical protein [Streptomyces sp. T7(2022)]MCK2145313.1 hypothetical protein [Streptomyces sp. WAC00276]
MADLAERGVVLRAGLDLVSLGFGGGLPDRRGVGEALPAVLQPAVHPVQGGDGDADGDDHRGARTLAAAVMTDALGRRHGDDRSIHLD